MKINLSKKIKNIETGNDTDFTVKTVIVQALLQTVSKGREPLAGDDKYKNAALAERVVSATNDDDFSIEDIVRMKETVGEFAAPLFLRQTWDTLEGK
ncbi:MAG: hypothetical protein WCP97_00490 [bacterium]